LSQTPQRRAKQPSLGIGHRFAKAENLVPVLELATFLEKLDAFKAFEDVAFSGNCTGPFEAAMLGHKKIKSEPGRLRSRDQGVKPDFTGILKKTI
jgi:hypothetical protein